MASIADIFFKALLDDGQLQTDAQKAGDKAGQTLGSRMSKGLSGALRLGLVGVAGVAGIATKGLVELDDITAQFTADTGATKEQADAAGKAILAMSSRNIQPIKEIGTTLSEVTTRLGLTGGAAAKTAEDFLHFARATGQDSVSSVKAFDDILDAWGLTADHAREIMDKLIVSHQKYGGSIAENESALSAMAPQLKALNLTVDDGIGLLNLFAVSGLDASAGQKALNAAISKLPPGESLKEFIAHLSTITDDGARAREAITVFGAKAGAAMANAIRPGIDSLDKFGVSAGDAAGATDKARDAIDSTFGARVQLLIKNFGAAVTGLGQNFGPLLTGLAALASLGGSLGLDKVLAKGFGKLGGSALVKGAATKAGLVIGAIFSGGMFVADKIAGGLASVLVKLPGAGIVRSAVLSSSIALGTLQGTTMGTAMGVALRLGFLGALVLVANDVKKAGQDIAREFNIPKMLGIEGFDLHPEDWPWPLGPKGAPDWAGGSAEARAGAESVGSAVAQGIRAGTTPIDQLPAKLRQDLVDGAPVVAAGAKAGISDPILGVAEGIPAAAAEAVRPTPRAMADALRDAQFHVTDAVQAIKDAIKNSLSKTKEIAQLEGFLTGDALAEALRSKKPEVRAEAEAWKAAAEERLFALRNDVPNIAQRTGQEYADALAAKKAQVAAAAQRLAAAARGKLTALKAEAYSLGASIGQHLTDGLYSKLGAFAYATKLYAGKMYALLRLGSPAKEGPLSKDGGPEGWGRKGANLYSAGWATVIPRLDQVFANLPTPNLRPAFAGVSVPGSALPASMPALAVAPSPTGGSGLVINGGIHVDARGLPDAAAVGTAVKQGVADAMADAFRDQSLRGVQRVRP